MKKWLKASTRAERGHLARNARTSVGQLRQIAGHHRKPSAELAIRLERAALKLRIKNPKLPLLLREHLARACASCEFARVCRPLRR